MSINSGPINAGPINDPGLIELESAHLSPLPFRLFDDVSHIASMRIYPFYRHIAVCPFWTFQNSHIAPMLFRVERESAHLAPMDMVRESAQIAPLALRSGEETSHSAPLPIRIDADAVHLASVGFDIFIEDEAAHIASLDFVREAPHIAPLQVREHADAAHGAPLPIREDTDATHVAPLRILIDAEAAHISPLPIGGGVERHAAHEAPLPIWDVYDPFDETIDISITRVSDGRVLHAAEFEIALSEADVHWSGSIVCANPDDALLFAIGDLVDLTPSAGSKSWRLLIESIDFNRPGRGVASASLRLVSPTVELDSPLAPNQSYSWGDARLASIIAAEIAAGWTLSWDRADWVVQPYRIALSDSSPIAALGWIADETRGIIYADEDGETLHVRDEFPVTIPAMDSTDPDLVLSDRDEILVAGESDAIAVGIDKVRVYDTQAVDSIQLEHEVENLKATTRAYPQPWRKLSFRTTRGTLVTISAPIQETRLVEDEIVEIEGGSGLAEYPILALQSATYLSDNLGAITVGAYSREIRTAQPDYSLLQITYTTRALLVNETATGEGIAQFVVEDA